jgi:hypothetical protein
MSSNQKDSQNKQPSEQPKVSQPKPQSSELPQIKTIKKNLDSAGSD